MWVPAAILILATALLFTPLRKSLVSESLVAFLLATVALLALWELDRLS